MLYQLMCECNNFFIRESHTSTYTIENQTLSLSSAVTGQYFIIQGSIFNDGLHKVGDSDLTDESFTGTVHLLAVPNAFVELAEKVSTWCESNGEATGPFSSESYGGYSYTRATSSNGGTLTWVDAFRSQLNHWRKV